MWKRSTKLWNQNGMRISEDVLNKGDLVRCRYTGLGICLSEPFKDKIERRKQYVYWMEWYKEPIPLSGDLINIAILRINGNRDGAKTGNKVYTYPIEKVTTTSTQKFRDKSNTVLIKYLQKSRKYFRRGLIFVRREKRCRRWLQPVCKDYRQILKRRRGE